MDCLASLPRIADTRARCSGKGVALTQLAVNAAEPGQIRHVDDRPMALNEPADILLGQVGAGRGGKGGAWATHGAFTTRIGAGGHRSASAAWSISGVNLA